MGPDLGNPMSAQTVQTTAVFMRRIDGAYVAKGLMPDGRPFHTERSSRAECRAWARKVAMVAAFVAWTS